MPRLCPELQFLIQSVGMCIPLKAKMLVGYLKSMALQKVANYKNLNSWIWTMKGLGFELTPKRSATENSKHAKYNL